jgi:hypothetical protein
MMELGSLMYSKLCFNLPPHTGGCLYFQLVRSLASTLPLSIDWSFWYIFISFVIRMWKSVYHRTLPMLVNMCSFYWCLRYFCSFIMSKLGRNSSVGIATGYGLDGPKIESRWGRDFPYLSRPALGPTQTPVQWVPALFRGKERPARDADPSPSFRAVVMKG